MFRDILSKGDPNMAMYRQNIQGTLNTQSDQAQRSLRENLAGSGMLRSGAATAGFLGLEANRSQALAGAETTLAQQDQDYRDKAISRLLGLETMKQGESAGNRDYAYKLRSLTENARQFDTNLGFEKSKSSGSPWGALLGGVAGTFLGGVGGSAGAALGSQLKF